VKRRIFSTHFDPVDLASLRLYWRSRHVTAEKLRAGDPIRLLQKKSRAVRGFSG
jgi:hypothetical protein